MMLFLLPSTAYAGSTSHKSAIDHVFIIMLENQSQAVTFNADSPAQYLSKTLRKRGAYLPNYYGVTHASQGNYTGMISGQGPSRQIGADCPRYTPFISIGSGDYHQLFGDGCIYPRTVSTIANQLERNHLRWHGYMEDMGNNPRREPSKCGQPVVNSVDKAFAASVGDQYATRHNPFVYFSSLTGTNSCSNHVSNLQPLAQHLKKIRTTANYTFITPNLCHDGHDKPCVTGEPGGLVSIDTFLREWVPKIVQSPAYRKDGLLLLTFDEASGDNSSCCGNVSYPNVSSAGGGRVGAVILSPFIKRGSTSTATYNHFSVLRSTERIFNLSPLGYAATAKPFSNNLFMHPIY